MTASVHNRCESMSKPVETLSSEFEKERDASSRYQASIASIDLEIAMADLAAQARMPFRL